MNLTQQSINATQTLETLKSKLQNLKSIEIQNKQKQCSENFAYNRSNQAKVFWKNQVYCRIKYYFENQWNQSISLMNNNKVQDQFIIQINPQYKELKSLPFKLYVCGYCKSFFVLNEKYLDHIFTYRCPINHQRSSYFFYKKKELKINQKQMSKQQSFRMIKGKQNQQIYDKISQRENLKSKNEDQNNIQIIQDNKLANEKDVKQYFKRYGLKSFDKNQQRYYNHTFNYQVQFIKNQQFTQKNPKNKFVCGKCKKQLKQCFYAKHCNFVCSSLNHKKNSHYIIKKRNQQPKKQFIEDIYNLTLNYNIFMLFDNFYLELIQTKQKSNEAYFCQKCQKQFQNSQQLLKHLIFICQNNEKNNLSEYLRKKILKKQTYQSYKYIDLNGKYFLKQKRQNNPKNLTQGHKAIHFNSYNRYNFYNQKRQFQDYYQTEISYTEKYNPNPDNKLQQQENGIKKLFQKYNINQLQSQDSSSNFNIHQQRRPQEIQQQYPQQQNQLQFEENRILLPNVDYDHFIQKKKYYCASCDATFKRQNILQQHIQICQNFQNQQSSHHYLTLARINQINFLKSIRKGQFKQYPKNNLTCFQNKKIIFKCGCTKQFSFGGLYYQHVHINHYFTVPQGSSHIIVRIKRMIQKSSQKKEYTLLPINLSTQVFKQTIKTINHQLAEDQKIFTDYDYKLVCPCNIHKKYDVQEFIKHIIVRHKGVSPCFYMKK